MSKEDRKQTEDVLRAAVLRRILATPPKPHKPAAAETQIEEAAGP